MDNVVKKLTSNSTVEQIEEELSKVCAKLGVFSLVCQDFVEKYTPELVAILSQDLNATRVCIKLGFCTNTTLETRAQLVAPPNPSPAECKLCTVR